MTDMNLAEFIGTKIIEGNIRRDEEILKMESNWTREGAELRKIREGLKISRRELSRLTHVSESVYARLEKGEYIRRRKAIVKTYITMMRCIPLMRKQDAGLIR